MDELAPLLKLLSVEGITVSGMLVAMVAWLLNERRLTKAEAAEYEQAADEATEKLHEARLLQLRADWGIEQRDGKIADLQRELDKCERKVERWQTFRQPQT